MWSQIVLTLFVGLAYASTNPSWKENTEYVYEVNGRTLSSLHEAADQYSGVLLKAKLHIAVWSEDKLQGRISEPQYAQVHTNLPAGWRSEIPDSQLNYKQLSLSEKPFEIKFERGLITKLTVEKEVSNYESNIIKSIVSQFQLDVQGQSATRSPMNNLPNGERMDGVFKTMEETVTGKTETLYDIHPLPEYLLQSEPWLAPQDSFRGEGDVIEVIKTKNFTNAEERPSYHYGFGKIEEQEPTYNKLGQFLIRESISRAILTGKLSKNVIQTSSTVNKIMVTPSSENQQMGSIVSFVNVTLQGVQTQRKQLEELSNPLEIGDLVYTYEKPYSRNNQVHKKLQGKPEEDSSSEESSESSYRRFRRNAMWNQQSEENSSEEQQQQPRPQMSRAPESPLLPTMMGYHGKSIKQSSEFNVQQNVEKLVQEISEEIQSPEKILKESTLNKYTMLNTLVRLMDKDEIESVAQQLYTQNQEGQERLAWAVYRDAVAEAGTAPAFLNIQQWIESRKIQKQEAAEVVATMAHAIRYPTEEYMRKFFELSTNSQVKQQAYLNETALLSYTELVHKVYINRNESHNQFPVHAFGSFYTKEGREFIKSTVITHLAQHLEQAISNGDARKIHIYIRALGNIGHKKILDAFEPYLEGDKQCSQFQRMFMICCLDQLARNDPEVARSVLYKVYQNAAELPEHRVVAVLLLIKTNPSVEMLQRMAENTNVDVQEQVNAAVKSVIESASSLESSSNQDLKKAAQVAKPLLTRKEYGTDQSFLQLRDYIVEQMGMEFQHRLAVIGSQESGWPKALGLLVEGESHGMKNKYFRASALISSVKELTNVLYKQTKQYQQDKSQRSQQQSSDSQWSSADIAKLMGYENEEREQLEGVIIAEMEHMQKLWSFDNQTIEQLSEAVREQEKNLKNGKHFNYAKLKQLKEMALSYPTEMGIPFLYTYDLPILMKCEGKIKASASPQIAQNGEIQMPDKISARIEAAITMTAKAQSHLSFVTPFDHQIYMAGFDRNMQLHVPVNAKIEVDVKTQQSEIELEVEKEQKDIRMLHFSSKPYTSRSDIMTITPVAHRPNTRVIKPQQPQQTFDVMYGKKECGLAFRAWGCYPEHSVNVGELVRIYQSEGIESMWDKIWNTGSLEQTEANIVFMPRQSTIQKVTLRSRFDQEYKRKPETQSEEDFLTLSQAAAKLRSNEPSERQQEMMKHVGSGIRSAQLYSADVSVELAGEHKNEHVFGLAFGKSNADPKSRAVIYYKNKNQGQKITAEAKADVPNTNGLDLTESLETEPQAKWNVRVQQGQNDDTGAKISAKFDLSRSKARKQYLMNEDTMYKVCKKEMQKRNFQLPACQNMTIRANFLDQIKYQLKFENFNKHLAEALEDMLKAARVYAYPKTEIDSAETQKNMVEGTIRFRPQDLRQVNFTVRANNEETKFYNISLQNEIAQAILVQHPVFHIRARVAGVVQGWENFRPTCVIDQTAAQTFSNKTYHLSLDQQYTVVMQYIPKDARENGEDEQTVEKQLRKQVENYIVLARQTSGDKKELMITLNHPKTRGKTVQIEMKPEQGQNSANNPAASVKVNGQQVHFDDKEIAELHDGFVEIYALPNGEVKVEIQNAFYLIFDGERVKLTATSWKFRDSIAGLCGRFSDDEHEDFTTPANCVLADSRKFVESYKIDKNDQRREERSGEWKQQCVQKVLPLYTDVISDRDAGRTESRRGQDQRHSSTGSKLRPRYVEDNGEICFTIRPLPQCNHSARKTVSKNVPVHCIEGSKTAYYLKSQIDQGGNPDFTRKSETKKIRMEVPQQCN
ncbi:unnamed protein product [Ceutorhynchus assimilis]|uniref:Vitellogenin n=1 Tax=Ceutorhynchus assimilis TaxID=467358 RepID=A0A9N9MGI1_9CUCU|nr:unnamed protein product [Ceutorhynchus assimilis]